MWHRVQASFFTVDTCIHNIPKEKTRHGLEKRKGVYTNVLLKQSQLCIFSLHRLWEAASTEYAVSYSQFIIYDANVRKPAKTSMTVKS